MNNEKLELLVSLLAQASATVRRAARNENRAKDKDDQLFWEASKLTAIGFEADLKARVAAEYKRIDNEQNHSKVVPLKRKDVKVS